MQTTCSRAQCLRRIRQPTCTCCCLIPRPSALRSSGMTTIWPCLVLSCSSCARSGHLPVGACARAHTGVHWPARTARTHRESYRPLVRELPQEMQAIHLACSGSDRLMVRLLLSIHPIPSPFHPRLPSPLMQVGGNSTIMLASFHASRRSVYSICTAHPYDIRSRPACTERSCSSRRTVAHKLDTSSCPVL